MKRPTNFDLYLEEQLKDPDFAERFRKAGEGWDVAVQLASLRQKAGLSQKELARKVGTSQQQISRLESPSYEGHSLSMLRRVARVLGAAVYVNIRSGKDDVHPVVADGKIAYGGKRKRPSDRLDAAFKVAREAFKKTKLTTKDIDHAVKSVRRKAYAKTK